MVAVVTPEIEASSQENPYEISDERKRHIDELTKDLLLNRPPTSEERFVCYRITGNDRYADVGRYIESTVFGEAFETGNGPEDMQREYSPYEDRSTFFVSVDQEQGVATGALRIIENGPNGFKTLEDLEEKIPEVTEEAVRQYHHIQSEDMEDCWDIGTVAVPREYRGSEGAVTFQLYRGMYVASQKEDKAIKHFFSVIAEKPYEKMTKFLGFPFKPLCGIQGPIDYIGVPSFPVYGDAPRFEESVRRKRWTVRGFMARKALDVLGKGTRDNTLQF